LKLEEKFLFQPCLTLLVDFISTGVESEIFALCMPLKNCTLYHISYILAKFQKEREIFAHVAQKILGNITSNLHHKIPLLRIVNSD